MKFHSVLIFSTTLFCCSLALASEQYICSHGDAERVISVVYQNAESQVPCEVQYDKGEGAHTLWSAQAEVGYCETKASEFVAKQESWGWSCEKAASAVYADDLVSDLY